MVKLLSQAQIALDRVVAFLREDNLVAKLAEARPR